MDRLHVRRTLRCTGAVLLAGLVSASAGCSRPERPDPPFRAEFVGERVALEVVWQVRVGQATTFELRRRELGGVALSEDQSIVVVTTANGQILALDAVDGRQLWSVAFGGAVDTQPVIRGGILYLALADGTLRALEVRSGQERWRYTAATIFTSRPAIAGDHIYVLGNDSRLHAVRTSDGRGLWTVERPRATDLSLHGACEPLPLGDGVIAGFVDGSLVRADLQGRVQWVTDLSAGQRRMADVDARPVVRGSTVYAASFSGGVYALDLDDGTPRWRRDITGASDLLIVGDRLVFSDGGGDLVHLDLETGEDRLRVPLDEVAAGSPVHAEQVILIPTRARGVLIVDANAAWIHGRFDPDSGFHAPPALGSGAFFVLSDGGWVHAVRFARTQPSYLTDPLL